MSSVVSVNLNLINWCYNISFIGAFALGAEINPAWLVHSPALFKDF